MSKICKKCILPKGFLGIEVNSEGLCNFCQDSSHKNVNWSKLQITKKMREEALADWNALIKDMQSNRGKQEYDCIIGYSGGKDSTALLDKFVNDYGLKPLAITGDTGFMTDIAMANMKKTLEKVRVEHILIEEAITTFTRLYRYYFENHDSNDVCLTKHICDVCSDLIHAIVVNEAIKRGIKTVIFGYSPDQIRRYFYEIPHDEILEWLPRTSNLENFQEDDKQWYPDSEKVPTNSIPRVLLPYHVIHYDEGEIIKLVESKKLIEVGKADPLLTNCHVVKAAILYDTFRYGGIPYALQYAELIRQADTEEKQIKSRRDWLRTYKRTALAILNGTFNVKGMGTFFINIGMTREELLDTIEKQRNKDPNKEHILHNIELIRNKQLK